MAKKHVQRLLKQDAFFDEIAHAAYAHSLLTFLCDVEYSTIEHEFVLEVRDMLSEEFNAVRDILLQELPRDDESILECQNYIKENFGVGLEIYNLSPEVVAPLHIVEDIVPMIEPHFLVKEELMIIVGHASVAFNNLMEMDSFYVSDSKEVEKQALVEISAILGILLRELSLHAPLIPSCEEYVMKEYELAIPFHLQ